MITCTAETLPLKAEEELREWLRKPQLETLRRVIAAKQKAEACLALRDAALASAYEAKLDAGNEHLRKAQRFQACLDVLKEVTEQTTPFTTAKLT